ncbi:MAG TPA: L17 family ribosomal protein [Clostridia bacterium]|nr:L17 family ribosomal protein [Clostridia bacterium]HPY36538.1 L17 family ribosomal protein [Clostridia bacterium]
MANRKLGRPTDQRVAILRGLTTALIWNGKLITTLERAKEVQPIAEKLVTLAVNEYQNSVVVKKQTRNEKLQIVEREVHNDLPSKLHARRQLMAYLYDVPEFKSKKESKSEYKERTADKAHPVVEKLFRELAPKYDKRAKEVGAGGYTRILKLGPRRGDAAEMALLELV